MINSHLQRLLGGQEAIWGVAKIRGTSLGVFILRTIVFLGLYWVPLFWETTI